MLDAAEIDLGESQWLEDSQVAAGEEPGTCFLGSVCRSVTVCLHPL